jgi:hypothetical protein
MAWGARCRTSGSRGRQVADARVGAGLASTRNGLGREAMPNRVIGVASPGRDSECSLAMRTVIKVLAWVSAGVLALVVVLVVTVYSVSNARL